MITENNMIYANPQAYRVFPDIGNPMNTGLVDKAVYTGHLVVTDSSGNTKSFSNTNTIDFTGFTGSVIVDQYTDTGSVSLGRWKMTQSIIITNDITITVTPISEVSSAGATITPQYQIKYNTYNNEELTESTIVTPDSITLQSNVEWITISNNQIVIAANTNTEARQGQVMIQVKYQEYSTSANYNIVQAGYNIAQDIKDAMVLWYDLKRQGATNESMAANPVLKDLSGNGHDATCYNFAWTEESGISTTNYPSALVSDGVDDYALVRDIPEFSQERGLTIIADRDWLLLYDEENPTRAWAFISNNDGGAFMLEKKGANGNRSLGFTLFNKGLDLIINGNYINGFNPNGIVALTSYSYNGVPFEKGNNYKYNPDIAFFRYYTNMDNHYGNIAMRNCLIFNRDLTVEEIDWVKTNLIEGDTEL